VLIVTLQGRKLERLVVDQHEDRIFGAKKGVEAITWGHFLHPFVVVDGTIASGAIAAAAR